MELKLFICENFQEVTNVKHLVEIMQDHNLVLTNEYGKLADGKLGFMPYQEKISTFVERAYRNKDIVNSLEIVKSSGPRFHFEAITRLKYLEPDIPRFDYITIICGGQMLGETYNNVSLLIDYHIPQLPDFKSPYFEEGTQLMIKLGKEFNEYLRPWYGWLDHSQDDFLSFEAIRDRKELDTLYWVNFYGPSYIEKYGADLFLNSPCWKKETLPDGGVFLQLSEFYTKPVNGEAKRKTQEHFALNGIKLPHSGNPFDKDYQE
jgi:hypothetical protein